MCEICLHNPHLRSCPLADETPECLCEQCGTPIYEMTERWVDDDRNKFCSEECAEKYHDIHKEEC